MTGDTPDQQLLFVTTRIDAKTADGKKVGTGTGFIVAEKIDEQRQVIFVVTCRHVVEGLDTATLSFVAEDNGKPKLGKKCVVEVRDLQKMLFFHPDPKIDVAVMPLVPILNHFAAKGEKPFFKALTRDLVPSKKNEDELSAIQPVLFIGYPSGIRDEANLLPITRRGVTATPYSVDYNNLPLFLIDATVFGGSSGSPVLVFDSGSYSTGSNIIIGSRAHFLGLVSQAYFHEQDGEVQFKAVPSAAVPVYKQRTYLNLGVVVKAQTVFATVDEFLKKFPPAKETGQDKK
ncbi:MAG: serine protease [Verrucomicrobiaceae bacterium]